MSFATWAYPWDIVDEGVENVAADLLDLGVTEISLATNYHAVQTLNPHNPRRRTFFARASSYFQPGDGYGRLEPVPNEEMGEHDWLARIDEKLASTGIELSSWTVGCHNSRLGMANQDLALVNPFGDPLIFGLCPSRPAVREYLVSLVADLDDRASFTRIELETFDYFHGTGFGWHHQKFHARLGDLGEFLFGLCFCDDCRESAVSAGIDVERARSECIEAIDALIGGDIHAQLEIPRWLADHQATEAYTRHRCRLITSLYATLAESVASSTRLGCYVGPRPVQYSWHHGLDLEAIAEHLDYIVVLTDENTRDDVENRLNRAASVADVQLHAGVTPSYPILNNEETVIDVVEGLREAGAERVCFYNYGLLPERNLTWIASAIEACD